MFKRIDYGDWPDECLNLFDVFGDSDDWPLNLLLEVFIIGESYGYLIGEVTGRDSNALENTETFTDLDAVRAALEARK